ncbi:hypothetical protein QQF64_029518, partial [Cirrhinus molitorella]
PFLNTKYAKFGLASFPAALPEVTARSDPSSVLPNIAVEFCSPITDSFITWPKTRQGLVAKQPCPPGTIGMAVFTCLGPEGLWDQQGPDLSNCTSTWVNIINQKIRAGEPAAIISRELSEQTKGQMHAGDITYTVRAMGHLIDLLDVQLRNLTPGGKDSAARSLNKLQKRERSCRYFVQECRLEKHSCSQINSRLQLFLLELCCCILSGHVTVSLPSMHLMIVEQQLS